MTASITADYSYKPIVDSLRAVAVTSVVAYHAGLPLPGGFVGVDVFFVISGFLIINHVVNDVRKGSFSFASFWSKRALRILPPYLLVIVAASIIAPFVLVLPNEVGKFGDQVMWSATMLVNHYFLGQQGYFDAAADTKPLLHLWSLAVEEQFYLVAPLAIVAWLFLARRSGAQLVRFGLPALILVVSLALCILYTGGGDKKNYAFFLMPLRAWEFIIGGSVAAAVPYAMRLPGWLNSLLVAIGMGMIAVAVLTFSSTMEFPSYNALLPVLGSALVIAAGVASPHSVIVRIATVQPILWIGLISYSWYLWHWPLLVFARIYNFGELSVFNGVTMALISLVLAVYTYFGVEKPILAYRRKQDLHTTWRPVLVGAFASFQVVLIGLAYQGQIYDQVKMRTANAREVEQNNRSICDLSIDGNAEACLAEAGDKPVGLIMGDSHAMRAFTFLQGKEKEFDVKLAKIALGRCVPIFDVELMTWRKKQNRDCVNGKEIGRAAIETVQPDFAILQASWMIYVHKGRSKIGEPGSGKVFRDGKREFTKRLKDTIAALKESGVRRILVLGPAPGYTHHPVSCINRAESYGIDPKELCTVRRKEVLRGAGHVLSWIKEAINGDEAVRFIDITETLCTKTWCNPYDEDVILFSDRNHLSWEGYDRVYRSHEDKVQWVFDSAADSQPIASAD